MSNSAIPQTVEYEAETVFAEDTTTFATHRPAVCAAIDLSGLKHDGIDSGRLVQRLQEMTEEITGPQAGSIKLKLHLAGHGATTVGTPTVDAMETFLAYAFGNPTGTDATAQLSAAASTTAGTGSTTTSIVTTASGTFTAGSLFRHGVKGDGGGDGQMNVVTTHIATALVPLIATPAALVNGAVIAPCVNFWFPENPSSVATVVAGIRMRVRTANAGVELHGCYATDINIAGLNTGDTPFIEITFGVSWWRYTATSGPSAVAQNQYNPAPVADGSFHVGALGSTVRVLRAVRDVSLSIKLGMVPVDAPGGVYAYQKYVGAKRVPTKVQLKFKTDFDAATATPTLDALFLARAPLTAIYTMSTTPGSMVGFAMPKARVTGPRPMQMNHNGLNRAEITLTAGTGDTTTTELTSSAFRLGLC